MEGDEHVENCYDDQRNGVVDQEVQQDHGLGVVDAPLLRIRIANDYGLFVYAEMLQERNGT